MITPALRIFIVFSCISLFSQPLIADVQSYSFGVVPQQSAKKLATLWSPILRQLQQETGIRFQFKTAKNIPEFEKRLASGDYDFAYMNPYHFTVFNQAPGYKALAVRHDQPIRGIIVVHKDSPITSLAQLQNERLVFPSPAAFAASVLPRAELTQNAIPFTAKYVSSHDSVYMNIAKGFFKAGGGVKRTFNSTRADVKDKLKILWVSKPFTPHAFAALPKVNAADFLKVQTALINMNNTPEGSTLLKSLKIKNGLVKADDSQWDDVRNIGLDLLNDLIQQ